MIQVLCQRRPTYFRGRLEQFGMESNDHALGIGNMNGKRRRGLIMVVTGNGKGKTTSALGLAFRALGNGFKVFILQYIKGKWKTGEKKLADLLRAHADQLGLD